MKGATRDYWNERSDEGLLRVVSYFEGAVKRDPEFALGYAGLADCYAVMARNGPIQFGPGFEKARGFAEKALELDENLAEAHTALANVLHYYDHDWKGAEAQYRRALELKPNYPTAHQWYSHVLAPQRRFSEAQREVTTALRLDPFSIIINHNMGAAYYYQGRFDEAIEQWKRTNEMDPTLLATHGTTNLVQAFVLSGRLGEAMQEVEKVSKLPKPVRGLHLLRAYVLAAMNRTPFFSAASTIILYLIE